MSKHSTKLLGLLFFVLISLASATDQERLANRQAKCANAYGYQYGTDAMAQCVERMGRAADQALDRINACLQRYTFGSPAYNLCTTR